MYLNRFARNQEESTFCLTITWDVFELITTMIQMEHGKRLTITWDVFEYSSAESGLFAHRV